MTSQVVAPSVLAATPPGMPPGTPLGTNDLNTKTQIKHVIIIYGENRSFDHVFGTYRSPSGDTVSNILSKGIVNEDGTPGPNFSKAAQFQAKTTDTYSVSPGKTSVYQTLPPPFATIQAAENADYGLLPRDLRLLTTGATGLKPGSVDTRIANANALPSGPYQLTPGQPYDAYAASPVHRYYQARQQADCDASKASEADPSGCANDLYPWVEVTIGAGSNGKPQPSGFNDATTGEGSTAMGFYNVQQGDMAYFKKLADEYTISDNYHQPGMGGTGLNSIPPVSPTASGTPTERAAPPHRQPTRSRTQIPSPARTTGTPRMATRAGRTVPAPMPASPASVRSSAT
ncbi:MAG TPA: alkaline phosphatase family protein [Rhodopila sp.]